MYVLIQTKDTKKEKKDMSCCKKALNLNYKKNYVQN